MNTFFGIFFIMLGAILIFLGGILALSFSSFAALVLALPGIVLFGFGLYFWDR